MYVCIYKSERDFFLKKHFGCLFGGVERVYMMMERTRKRTTTTTPTTKIQSMKRRKNNTNNTNTELCCLEGGFDMLIDENLMKRKGTTTRRTRRTRRDFNEEEVDVTVDHHHHQKKKKLRLLSPEVVEGQSDYLDGLPDDLVLYILSKIISSAKRPSHFINVLSTCKRLNGLGLHRLVLAKASPKSFAVKAENWSESAHRFLKRCVDAGNIEASYTLGMIRFYCLENRGNGASLMAKAAINSYAPALYSLAVIQFNGSGGSKNDKDLRAGVALSARAAYLGHIDAIRELGHCLQDGYGVRRNIAEGRRFLVEANAREISTVMRTGSPYGPVSSCPWARWYPNHRHVSGSGCPLLSDFGCAVPPPESHPANKFLSEWFALRGVPEEGLRLCSHTGCGRPETRKHEFRRCSVCGTVNYCSRACQALDWKFNHKSNCEPPVPNEEEAAAAGNHPDVVGMGLGIENDNGGVVQS